MRTQGRHYKWTIVKRSNGKFYPKVEHEYMGRCWPYTPSEFDTLDEAKTHLLEVKAKLEDSIEQSKEMLVFELKSVIE